MAKDINTNSKEWCDIVFEGKNKKYGAYQIRLSSSKRHVWSFFIGIATIALLASLPYLIERIEFYLFQHSDKNYVIEDYAYISENLTEVELTKLSRQYIPNADQKEIEIEPSESKPKKVINKDLLVPVIVEDAVMDESYIKDLMGEDTKVPEEDDNQQPEEKKAAEMEDGLYLVVDVMPSFPGGEAGLMDYIYRNLRYPAQAKKERIESSVICTFIIDANGNVTDVEITQSAHPLLNSEAVRLIKSLPKWKPAQHKGKPIKVKYFLPIVFRLK